MGMYHYVYSPRHRLKLYVAKTDQVPKPKGLDPDYEACRITYEDGSPEFIRVGTLLQQDLRRHGFREKLVRPLRYQKGRGRDRYFFGHTYLDARAIPLIEKAAQLDSCLLLLVDLVRQCPGRWYFYGDDMGEPLRVRKGTVRGDLVEGGRYLPKIPY